MRWITMAAVALLLTAASPAFAWSTNTMPGDKDWPEIPDRAGMTAFLGDWIPGCNNGAYQQAGNMTIHDDGRITFAEDKKWGLSYRVIETTPYYVVTLARYPKSLPFFWVLRPLGALFQLRGTPEMVDIGIHQCRVFAIDEARIEKMWTASDAELLEFWKTNSACNPRLTKKSPSDPFWGEWWGQTCNFGR
ncbi:MAG: hypothetical protein VB101_06600 [Rhodospirillaceae bacterium]|nr:hypothetical protein [Rhodospirillaceae bacterium]